MYGLTEAFRSTSLDPALVDDHPDSVGTAIPFAEVMMVRADGTRGRARRGGRAGPCRAAGRAGLLAGSGADRRALQARASFLAMAAWPSGRATARCAARTACSVSAAATMR